MRFGADYYQKFSEKITFGGENLNFQIFPYDFCGHLPSPFHILKVFPK
jgi:hypothetical protein